VQAHTAIIADRGAIATGTLVYQRPEPVARPMRLAPRPAPLAGREQPLAEMRSRLGANAGAGPRVVALCGLGGVGKTSLAVEYAHRHISDYSLVWQVTVGSRTAPTAGEGRADEDRGAADSDPATVSAEFAELARQLGAYDPLDSGADVIQQVHSALAARTGRWLLILDNAADPAAVRRLLPAVGTGEVVITSQHDDWPDGWRLPVPVLEPEPAAAFLLARSGDSDTAAAAAVAQLLGELPLALEQAGAYVRATGLTLAGYQATFTEFRRQLLDPEHTEDITVAATISLGVTRLERTAPTAVALLRLLACCAPDAIPTQLLLRADADLPANIPAPVAAQTRLLLGTTLAGQNALRALRRFSLCSPPTSGGTVSVHRLIQAVVLDQLPTDVQQHWRTIAGRLIEAALPEDPEDPASWPPFAALLPHAVTVLRASDASMRAIGAYLYATGDYTTAHSVRDRIHHEIRRVHGDDHADTAASMNDLGEVLQALGNYPAGRALHERALQIRRRVLGDDHRDTLTSVNDLAYAYESAGDLGRAIPLFERALTDARRVLGDDHRDTLTSVNDLAYAYESAGDLGRAIPLLERTLTDARRVLGDDHRDTLTSAHNLAYAYQAAGNLGRAIPLLERTLTDRRRVLGPNHPDTLTSAHNLAYAYQAAGNLGRPRFVQAKDRF
jgi:tetratricopeptide (TPR) repeat protein